MAKNRLGKGLSALIPSGDELWEKNGSTTEVPVERIIPNRYQPRRKFDEEKLAELAQSIREHGVLQPVMVRPRANGDYELVVGERRLRACRNIGLETIPAVVREISDQEMVEMALIENIQRHDLNPVEEAQAYKRLMTEFGFTQEQLAVKLGKSRPQIANMIRLLKLPPEVLEMLAEELLSVGQVRPLLAVGQKAEQIYLARQMLEQKTTAREAEHMVQGQTGRRPKLAAILKRKKNKKKLPADISALEQRLRSMFGTKVKITYSAGKGKIEIDYYSDDDLERILNVFISEDETE